MNLDYISSMAILNNLEKQINQDMLNIVDPFIGKELTQGIYQEITNKCTQHLEQFYGQYYNQQQYVLRANVTSSETSKNTLVLGWRLCERLVFKEET